MQHQIIQGRSLLQVDLLSTESLFAAPGAMVGMSANLQREALTPICYKRHQPFCIEKFSIKTTEENPLNSKRYRIDLAPFVPGPILHLPLSIGKQWLVNASAWLASATTVEIDATWGGAHGFFSDDGPLLLKVEGTGPLFVGAASAFHVIDVRGEHSIFGSALVAFEGSLQYEIKRSFTQSTQALYHFSGRGRVLVQNQPLGALARWAEPFLESRRY
jgi:uncharacterized protein (TIGR00266 family)